MKGRITVTVQYEQGREVDRISLPVDSFYQEVFSPMNYCDDDIVAYATGDIPVKEAKKVVEIREDVGRIIAKEVADCLLRVMRKRDTFNGYPVGDGYEIKTRLPR